MNEILIDHSDLFLKPSLILRVKSNMIDSAIIIVLMCICSIILNGLKIESGNIRLSAMLLIILYEPIFVALGSTIGQRIMGLEIIKSSAYKQYGKIQKTNIINSFFRYISKIGLSWISLLTIHSSKYGQAIHDKIGNSIMTHK